MSKPGRKPLVEGQPSVTFTVRLSKPAADDACRLALRQGVSVSSVLREALRTFLANDRGAHFAIETRLRS